ncbi:MAG: alpha/beta fold hydrolase [Candidatus Nanopelagicales bacterium]
MPDDESILDRASSPLDAVVRWGAGPDDVADVRYGDPALPLVVLIHGGFWRPAYDRVHVRATTEGLNRDGWTVVAPEYRRTPGDPDATTADVAAALAALPGLLAGRHNGRVVVLGHSAGGHLALWAAAAAAAPGLVLTVALGAVASLALAESADLGSGAVAAFLGGPATGRPDLDPALLPTPSSEVVLVHGAEDVVVPPEQAAAYAAAHPRARVVEVPGCGHFGVIDPESDAWHAVVGAVRSAP